MGWETRRGRGAYYTRSRKVAGRVVREYYGSGAGAQAMAELDQIERMDRQERREERAEVRAQLAAIDEPMAVYSAAVDDYLRRYLVAAGYHQHHRGEWRKRRGDE